MANKIISFGSSDESFIDTDLSASSTDSSLDVYLDLNMQSSPSAKIQINGISAQPALYKIEKNANVKAVVGALKNIFSWIPGERILLPEFGSRLKYLLYEGINAQTEEAIVAEIRQSVSEWEPRAQITEVRNVSTIDDTEDNTIHLEVIFTIPGLSEEQYSYSFTYNRPE